jgi:restriction system protein
VPIPDYQEFMLPLLQCLSDGRLRTRAECRECAADHLGLTAQEREEMLPSGKATVLQSRAGWAVTYLTKAGLLQRPQRGHVQITDRGQAAIQDASRDVRIDNAYLRKFQEFREFVNSARQPGDSGNGSEPTEPGGAPSTRTPQEVMDTAHQSLRAALASDLLDRIKSGSPQFFERLVLDLLVAMGYGGSREDAAHAVGRSGDDGIDGIIKEDKLGLESIYLQAKRWEGSVGRPVVQGFAGSLEGQRARKGVFITTSKFSQDAHEYVRRIEKRIVLIDGEQLTNLMIDHGVGVADVAVYSVRRVDEDYFDET